MASQTISGQRWADGTTVSVYPAAAWPDPSQAPSGTAVATAAVAGGAVTFTGLAENVRYVAYAGGLGVRFVVPQLDPTDTRSLRARVDELVGDTLPAVAAGGGHLVNVASLGVLPGLGTINAAINAYIAANTVTAQKGGITFSFPGSAGDLPYNLDPGAFEVPVWVNMVGAGKRTATRFLGHADGTSRLRFRSRGGLSGHFTVSGAGFETDGVQRTFIDIDVRSSPGDSFLISNAQNNTFIGCDSDSPTLSGWVWENGAKNNTVIRTEVESSGRAHVETRQTLAQGAAHPWGSPGFGVAASTVIDAGPNRNVFMGSCVMERLNVSTGVAAVYMRGGDLTLRDVEIPNGVTVPQVLMDQQDVATYCNLILDSTRLTANGTASSVGVRTVGAGTFYRIDVVGKTKMDRLATAWNLGDNTQVHCNITPDYTSTTTRFTANGGTKTEDQLIRCRQVQPVEVTRPNNTDNALLALGPSGTGVTVRPDGIFFGNLTDGSPQNHPWVGAGTGSPEGVLSRRPGSVWGQEDGVAGKTVWTKAEQTGVNGWVPGVATSLQTIATDANASVANGGAEVTFHTGTLTADRTFTLNAVTAVGQRRRVTRTGAGAFNLNVLNKSGGATIKAIATNQWADFLWDGTNWQITAFGSL